MRICIAGSTGFIGRHLIEELSPLVTIVALTRRPRPAENNPQLIWKTCDLFSLRDTEMAMEGCDAAIYLVHSMLPSARLVQGRFEDLDLILADNFARAARKVGIKKMLYLGGLMPSGILSRHLDSRLEVESTLQKSCENFYGLRAGLIVGAGGSSFQLMTNLVWRLPVMICPRWTLNLTQPIALPDIIQIIKHVMTNTDIVPGVYDVGGPEQLTYLKLMQTTADILHKKRLFIPVRFLSIYFSKLWVILFSSAPRALVSPLVESLKHQMIAQDLRLQEKLKIPGIPFATAVGIALAEDSRRKRVKKSDPEKNGVISIQRLSMPQGWSALDVAKEYARWIEGFFKPFIDVILSDTGSLTFSLQPLGIRKFRFVLLKLQFSNERSTPERALFYIEGGILDRESRRFRGRLEFRAALNEKILLGSIVNYQPRLPWIIYQYTQAWVHVFVMKCFGQHLKDIIRKNL